MRAISLASSPCSEVRLPWSILGHGRLRFWLFTAPILARDAVGPSTPTLPDGGRVGSNPKLLCGDPLATNGIRASGRQYPVQHRHADGSFGLLGRKAAGAQPRSDQRLVTTHCRFY